MVQGRVGAQHHPPEVGEALRSGGRVSARRDRTVGVVWTLCVVTLVVALLAALVVTVREPTARGFARWTVASLLLGAPLMRITARYRGELRRFFGR